MQFRFFLFIFKMKWKISRFFVSFSVEISGGKNLLCDLLALEFGFVPSGEHGIRLICWNVGQEVTIDSSVPWFSLDFPHPNKNRLYKLDYSSIISRNLCIPRYVQQTIKEKSSSSSNILVKKVAHFQLKSIFQLLLAIN